MIAVTGANGYIAQATLRFLASNNQSVVAISRGQPNFALPEGVTWRSSSSYSSMCELFHGCDSVIHLAGRAHIASEKKSSTDFFDLINRKLTLDIVSSAKAAGVEKFLFVSTVGVHGTWSDSVIDSSSAIRPDSAYAISKVKAEVELREFCFKNLMQLCVVRPPMVYGPASPGNFQRLVKLIKSGVPLPFGSATAVRSFIYVDNLASFLAVCASKDLGFYSEFVISDGSDWSTMHLTKRITELLDIPCPMFSFPCSLLRLIARGVGRSREMDSLTRPLVINSLRSWRKLDWQPIVNPNVGLIRALEID